MCQGYHLNKSGNHCNHLFHRSGMSPEEPLLFYNRSFFPWKVKNTSEDVEFHHKAVLRNQDANKTQVLPHPSHEKKTLLETPLQHSGSLKLQSCLYIVSTQLKNISQIASFPQVGVKIKKLWNHHPVIFSTMFRPWTWYLPLVLSWISPFLQRHCLCFFVESFREAEDGWDFTERLRFCSCEGRGQPAGTVWGRGNFPKTFLAVWCCLSGIFCVDQLPYQNHIPQIKWKVWNNLPWDTSVTLRYSKKVQIWNFPTCQKKSQLQNGHLQLPSKKITLGTY